LNPKVEVEIEGKAIIFFCFWFVTIRNYFLIFQLAEVLTAQREREVEKFLAELTFVN
jgi:hypothetical protein